jgi:hypothetical protein
MFLILGTIIIMIIIFFWHNIAIMISSVNNTGQSSKINQGYIWFIGLLILNITILIFIIGFYYYKSGQTGKPGIDGDRGFPGQSGETAFADIPCYQQG